MVPDLTEHIQIATGHLSQQAKKSQTSPILAMSDAENCEHEARTLLILHRLVVPLSTSLFNLTNTIGYIAIK